MMDFEMTLLYDSIRSLPYLTLLTLPNRLLTLMLRRSPSLSLSRVHYCYHLLFLQAEIPWGSLDRPSYPWNITRYPTPFTLPYPPQVSTLPTSPPPS